MLSSSERHDDFDEACEAARVPPEDRGALRRLLEARPPTSSRHERMQCLLASHSHWRLYVAGRNGDGAAARTFESHWRRHARAYFTARFSAADADELTAVFFERTWRLVGLDFAWESPFDLYLQAVLLNVGRDHLRRLQRERARSVPLEDLAETARASDLTNPERATASREHVAAIERALARLPPAARSLLALVAAGESADDLSARLGLQRDALHQRISRARKQLRALLAEEAGEAVSPGRPARLPSRAGSRAGTPRLDQGKRR